jgi:hypothetical protein
MTPENARRVTLSFKSTIHEDKEKEKREYASLDLEKK